jgi:hypothetical protein
LRLNAVAERFLLVETDFFSHLADRICRTEAHCEPFKPKAMGRFTPPKNTSTICRQPELTISDRPRI